MSTKKLYLLVGVSGSGKSTYASKLSKYKHFICEADNFPGLYLNGKLKFSLLEMAHAYCYMCVEERMKESYKSIIQSNTNLDPKHIRSYILLAKKYEYKVYIILPSYDLLYFDTIKGRKRQIQHLISSRGDDRPNSPEGYFGYKHVPKDKIISMIRKFDKVKPFYETLIKIHDPNVLLKMIS